MPFLNKTNRLNSNRKIVQGIKKHITQPVTFAGTKYTPGQLARMFQNGIDKADATDAAKRAYHAAVASEQDNLEELSTVQGALRSYASAYFGETSTEFTDFGFAPRKVAQVDVATKAAAALKRADTRAAGGKKGKKQQAKTTGAPAPASDAATEPGNASASSSTSTPTSNGTSTPTSTSMATTSPSNGVAPKPATTS